MELMQAHENKGYDVSGVIPFYHEGMKLLEEGNIMELRAGDGQPA